MIMFGILLALTAATMNPPAPARTPVLLELFTSEGCSSCPPADALLEKFDRDQPVAGADLVVISEHVDYWNHLGWADPFSSAQFSTRQRDYAARLETGEVYTPQLVIDGRVGLVGSEKAEAISAIQKAVIAPKLPLTLTASRSGNTGTVRVESAGQKEKADLYLVLASDHAQSHVERGENAGRALTHVAVAYSFVKIAAGRDINVKLKSGETRVIAFEQDRVTGKVLGVAMRKLN